MAKRHKAQRHPAKGDLLKLAQDAKRAADAHKNERYAEAAELYAAILRRDPKNSLTLHMMALCLIRLGRLGEACEALRSAAAHTPDNANIAACLGDVLAKLEQPDEAKAAFERACALQPAHKAARRGLARLISDQPDGLATLRGLLAENPLDTDAALAFGRAMMAAGEPSEVAIQSWLDAEKRGALTAWNLLEEADHAYLNNQPQDAAALLRAASVLQPDDAAILCNIGGILFETDATIARQALQTAISLNPNDVGSLYNMATLHTRAAKYSDAINYYMRILAINPQHAPSLACVIDDSRHICEWANLSKWVPALSRELAEGHLADAPPFMLLNFQLSPRDLLQNARAWAASKIKRGAFLPPPPAGDPSRRIRIGYLSSDLYEHATSYLAVGMFEHHDREKFEIFAYSHGRDDDSQTRHRVMKSFDHFVEVGAMTDRQAARRIRDDGIDILVDMKGYTSGSRTSILSMRPAPVQVNFLGFPGTLGADFIDYIVGDRIITPLDAAGDYDEKIVQLPNCYQPNDSRRALPEAPPSRAQCGLPDDGFVFCCFNNTYKITPEIFDVWMRLLDQVPGSVLWLLEANSTVRDNLFYEAASRGVDPDRLAFAPYVPGQQRHLARYAHADLFLDTLPINAHTTASDALWTGVPLITCPGDSFVSRVAASLLHAVDLPELVASSLDEYEALALAIARDPERLAALKAHLVRARTSATLFDTATYTRDLEKAYLRMHALRCAGKPPEPIVV